MHRALFFALLAACTVNVACLCGHISDAIEADSERRLNPRMSQAHPGFVVHRRPHCAPPMRVRSCFG